MEAVLTAIGAHTKAGGEKGVEARKEYDYFSGNRQRMDYAAFRAQGLCVGSGVVEAGCKVVIWQRFKRSGMFWSEKDANAMLALRCSFLSGQFDAFWNRYKAANQGALTKVA